MRKDGGDIGAAVMSSHSLLSFSCLDAKPFVVSLVVLSLVVAIWLLQPYESLLFSSSCSISNSSSSTSPLKQKIATSTTSNFSNLSSSSSCIPPRLNSTVAAGDTRIHTFRPYGSAAALFVQIGDYRCGPNTFAIVGLASKPVHVFGKPWFKCEWVPNSKTAPSICAKAFKMLPYWGYGRIYTVVVMRCTFPVVPNVDNAGDRLFLYAYYSPSPRCYEKIVALEEAPSSYNQAHFHPPYKYEYLYCGSSLYGNLNASRIREWIAYHAHFFGPRSHFVFHDAGGMNPSVRAVVEPWVKLDWAMVEDIRVQSEYDGYYYNQFLVVNDCLFVCIVTGMQRTGLSTLMCMNISICRVEEHLRKCLVNFPNIHNLRLNIIQCQALFVLGIPIRITQGVLREWGFEKLVFRNSITGLRRDRKYAIQAKKMPMPLECTCLKTSLDEPLIRLNP